MVSQFSCTDEKSPRPRKFQCEHHYLLDTRLNNIQSCVTCSLRTLSQSHPLCDVGDFEDLQFSTDRWYSSGKIREKILLALGVILEGMLGNCSFQSPCSENVGLKSEGQGIQNVRGLPPDGTMHHKANAALCRVLACPSTNGLSRLLPEGRQVQRYAFSSWHTTR